MMKAKQRYRIGVIGAGARGETFARELYAGSARAELFGVCDIDNARLDTFCEYCGLADARRFTDPTAFMNNPDLDAVVITVPEFAHKEVACAAMEAGKHVYIEKPLAHTLEDAQCIVDAQRESGVTAFVGFNLRAVSAFQKMKTIVESGQLGQIMHVSGLEQLAAAHGAAYMRRYHRRSSLSGGLLNQKGCHDIDLMLWFVGHEHRVVRVSSFGGTTVLTPDKKPANTCHECPRDIFEKCPYHARAGFVFPVSGSEPIYHRDRETYGGDMCVYNTDKDIVDNQTVIMEFDNGVCGDFQLRMFQDSARKRITLWGEKGVLEMDSANGAEVQLKLTDGETTESSFKPRPGGHGGADPYMIGKFIDAIENGRADDSGLEAGLAAAIVALKADESRLQGCTVDIAPEAYR